MRQFYSRITILDPDTGETIGVVPYSPLPPMRNLAVNIKYWWRGVVAWF